MQKHDTEFPIFDKFSSYKNTKIQKKHKLGRYMRSNHSTWDPRRPIYEELHPPPVPRRHPGSGDCYHTHPGSFTFKWEWLLICFISYCLVYLSF